VAQPTADAPAVAPAPDPSAAPAPAAAATPVAAAPVWPWVAGGAGLLALLLALAWWRNRRQEEVAEVDAPEVPPEPDPEIGPDLPPAVEPPAPAFLERPAPPPAPAGPRPRLELVLEPRRGGLNLVTATLEAELSVRNVGDADAEEIAVAVQLFGARTGQDEAIGARFAEPGVKPATPPFALPAGHERRLRVVTALPRAELEPLVAGGRPMFVPVVAADARYRWAGEGAGQAAASWIVGIARDGSDKLAPFWLDVPPRMHDGLAARPHTLAVAR
jgi:hypothetical protein